MEPQVRYSYLIVYHFHSECQAIWRHIAYNWKPEDAASSATLDTSHLDPDETDEECLVGRVSGQRSGHRKRAKRSTDDENLESRSVINPHLSVVSFLRNALVRCGSLKKTIVY